MVLILLISMLPIFTIPGVGAASWTGPVTVTNDTNNHYSSSLVQDQKGNVYLFWDQNPGIYYIITNTGQIASNTWPAPKLYTRNSNYDVTTAPVALKNGTLIIFFSSKRGHGSGSGDCSQSRCQAGILRFQQQWHLGLGRVCRLRL